MIRDIDTASRPRFRDIAGEAGVGTATVERVLNARGNVAPQTVLRVIAAARKLGYDRALPPLYHASVRIEVVLVRLDTPFYARLNREFVAAPASADKALILHRSILEEATPEAIAARIRQAAAERAGLIVVVQDHPAIVAALRACDARGLPVVLLVSDVQYGGRAIYVGIDNESAGRTAGFFMRHLLGGRSGRVLTLCHGGGYLVHRQRLIGFSQYFPDPDDRLAHGCCLMGRDADDLSCAVVREALKADAGIVGLYNAGGGNDGVDRALRESGRAGDVVFIGHEVSPGSRAALAAGRMMLAIDQAPELQVRRAIEIMEALLGLRPAPPDCSPIGFRVVTPENLGP
jgi:LacI family transcriptional regulator